MSGAAGTVIPAADYNTIQSTISSVMGTASQGSSLGYGQTLVSSQVAKNNQIKATDWQNLYTDISRAYTHQTGAAPTSGVLPAITKGTAIRAADISLYTSAANTCNTNRLNVAAANLTTVAPVAGTTITRATAWGNGSVGITAVMKYTWASEAQAASFFNTGGYITMTLNHATTTTTQDSAWNTFLAAFGTFVFSGTGCANSGGKTMSSIAYSALTATPTNVVNALAMTTASYTANYVTVTYVKIANGIQLTILLEDNHTNAFSDSVAAGTKAAFGYVMATDSGNLPTAQVAPTYATITNF